MPHKPFRILSEPLMADPLRRARVEEAGRANRIILALADLRGLNREAGAAPAPHDGAAAEMLRIGEEDSLFLDHLRFYIEEMGGHLEVTAVFPDERVQLLGSETKGPMVNTAGPAE